MLNAPRHFQIEVNGRTFSGSYTIKDEEICVGSAYGSKSQRVSKSADLDKLAKMLLRKIVTERSG